MRTTTMKFFIVLTLALGGLKGYAQTLSNRGTEFWVAYGHHQFMERDPITGTAPNTQNMVLYFSAEDAAVVRVSITGTAWTRTYNVPANTVISTETATPVAGFPLPLTPGPMPKSGTYDCRMYDDPPLTGNGGDGLFPRHGIHIESDIPIVAYAHIFGVTNSGATMLMPTDTWGYSYVSVNSQQSYADNCFSWAYVVSNHDNTVVEITPSVQTRNGSPAGVPFTVTLNRGEIYQIMCADLIPGPEAPEVSGTKFRSIANAAGQCYPIAAFSGSSRTRNHMACNTTGGGGDNDNQQLVPVQAWGKRYLTAPTSSSVSPSQFMTNGYKVLVKDPSTQVRRNGTLLTGLSPNGFYFFESNTADLITADKPVLVAQFMSGGGCLNGGNGDPEMIYISPMEQEIRRIGFFRNNAQNILTNYLTLIVPSGGTGLSSLTIDGIPFNALPAGVKHSYPHPRMPGRTIIVRRWSGFAAYPATAPGQCLVQSDSAFTAITYGLGGAESYGYNAGTMINNLSAISSIQNTLDPATAEHPFTCTNTPIKLSALLIYQPTQLIWQLSQLGSAITPNTDVTDNAPVSSGTVVIDGVTYYKYTLPGTYMFNVADTFEIPIRPTHPSIDNCYNAEDLKIRVIVKPKPKANFTFTHTSCALDTAYFTGAANTVDGYTLNAWNWTFPGPITATGQNVKNVFAPGTHDVLLSVVTAEGCASDTTKQITVNPKPTTNFTAAPPAVCEDNEITFTPNSTYADPSLLNGWYWDFGNGITLNATNGNQQTHLYPDYGTFTVKQVAKYGNLCISDTAFRVVTIYAKPIISFDYPVGCLPPGGLVQFTSTATTPDGQTLIGYAWDFGDPGATPPGNPNTSTLQNPTHVYSSFGSYEIMHTAVTNNGCRDTARVTASFNVRPILSFTPLAAVCESAAPVSVATGSVTNGVPGTGIYRGPGTDDNGLFNPATAGAGTHTIWYVYTSTAGCADSLPQDILVHAKPAANFMYPAGCLPATGFVQFTNTTTIADAQIMTWSWNFDDPNANAGNPNTSTVQDPTHNFTESTYDVNLTATSSNGCIGQITIPVTFRVTPSLVYPPLNAVCENAAAFSVATATVANGLNGTGTYSGPGISGAGMFNPAVAGPGTHTITYVFTSTGGCAETITQTIQVFAKPNPNFTFSSGCLATNGLAQFTNTSTIADAQTMTWSWNFDDPNANAGNPNTSTAQHPTHNYSEGTYDVVLTATSSNNCVNSITIPATFSLRPQLSFPPIPGACESADPYSIGLATVTNGVSGTGVYSGPGVSASGMFDPGITGLTMAGTYPIKYVFTTTGGCKDSITQNVTVFPLPQTSFLVNPQHICLGDSVLFTNTSTVSTGNIVLWKWNFYDGNTADHTNGNPFYHTFNTIPTSWPRLIVITDSGCGETRSHARLVGVHPYPSAAFSAPPSICLPGAATFTNASNMPPGSGVDPINYQWDFGDGNNSTNENPSHTYATGGTYNVSLIATSSWGCADTLTKVVDDFFDKPVAAFTVTPQELCQGMDNVFRDGSSAPNSTITGWSWNFDDNTSSTAANPTKRFNTPGVFDVSLVVTNQVGCTSDPFVIPVTVHLQPIIDAGQSFIVPQGTTVQFTATANSTGLTFSWTPPTGLSDPTALKPSLIANQDATYTLTATGEFGCTASDFITVKIFKPVTVPNVFSPNGDNIHDRWVIPNLADYPGATVEIFNRYGQQVFYSAGYGTPWDGTYKGKDMPVGTYYYIIQLKNGFKPMTGSVTIIR